MNTQQKRPPVARKAGASQRFTLAVRFDGEMPHNSLAFDGEDFWIGQSAPGKDYFKPRKRVALVQSLRWARSGLTWGKPAIDFDTAGLFEWFLRIERELKKAACVSTE